MSARALPREYGVKLTCNGCGAVAQTAMCGIQRNREWQSTQGWGKGSDPGIPARNPLPEREVTYQRNGLAVTRKLPASAGTLGRPSTLTHDLCPPCLKADREALEQRKAKRAARLVALDAKRKERDAMMRHSAEQKAADST